WERNEQRQGGDAYQAHEEAPPPPYENKKQWEPSSTRGARSHTEGQQQSERHERRLRQEQSLLEETAAGGEESQRDEQHQSQETAVPIRIDEKRSDAIKTAIAHWIKIWIPIMVGRGRRFEPYRTGGGGNDRM